MTTAKRILDAVTLRRVVAALLIGGFSKETLSFLGWLAGTGWGLLGVASVRGLLLATLVFAIDASLIYLALRGLASVLERRSRERTLASEEAVSEEHEPAVAFGEIEAGGDAADWPLEGGGDGREPDHY